MPGKLRYKTNSTFAFGIKTELAPWRIKNGPVTPPRILGWAGSLSSWRLRSDITPLSSSCVCTYGGQKTGNFSLGPTFNSAFTPCQIWNRVFPSPLVIHGSRCNQEMSSPFRDNHKFGLVVVLFDRQPKRSVSHGESCLSNFPRRILSKGQLKMSDC